jgi:hypothetical protein
MLDTHERQAGGAEESIQLLVRKGEIQKALSQFFSGDKCFFPAFNNLLGPRKTTSKTLS